MAKAKAVNKLTDTEISTILLDYFNKQMKPYAINDILNNLNLMSCKKQVVALLDQLTNEQKLVSKQFGKSQVWIFAFPSDVCTENVGSTDRNKIKEDLSALNKTILEFTAKKKELLAKKHIFSQFVQDTDVLKHALDDTEVSINKKLLIKEEVSKTIAEIKNTRSKDDADFEKINAAMKLANKKAKALLSVERVLKSTILTFSPNLTKKNLNKFLIDEIGCESIAFDSQKI
ncbi:hypothetical protein ACO0OL_002653 [Hanseniaspora opuntiae]